MYVNSALDFSLTIFKEVGKKNKGVMEGINRRKKLIEKDKQWKPTVVFMDKPKVGEYDFNKPSLRWSSSGLKKVLSL